MAIITSRMEVCDVCKDTAHPVTTKIRMAVGAQRIRSYVLCANHGKEVADLAATLTPGQGMKHARRGQVTMGDIEQVKKARAPRQRRGGTKAVSEAVTE